MIRFLFCALLLGVVAVWGLTFVVVKDAIAIYGVIPFLAVRFAIASIVMAPLAVRRIDRAGLRVGAGIGVVLAASYLAQTFGLRHTTATNCGLITGLFVVFTPLANRLLFAVHIRPILWGAIGASTIGLLLLAGIDREGLGGPGAGDALTLAAAALLGLHVALLDRHAKRHDPLPLAFAQLAASTALFLAIWPLAGPIAPPPRAVWPALALTAVVATAIGFFVQTTVQRWLSAVETALIIALEPVFALIFGIALAGDRLAATQVAGAALMLGAMLFAEVYPILRRAWSERSAGT